MNFGWQDPAALALVAGAVFFLVRRVRRVGRGEQATGCGACPRQNGRKGTARLISIDLPAKPSDQ